MRLKDCVLLGSAKLRLRRKRTVVCCIMLSLLFGLVVMILMVCNSFFNGLLDTSGKAFGGKVYLENSISVSPEHDGEVLERATELYESSNKPDKENPVLTKTLWGEEVDPYLDGGNEFAQTAIREWYTKMNKGIGEQVAKNAAKYGGRVTPGENMRYSLKNGRIEETDMFPDSYYAPGGDIEVKSRDVLERYITSEMPKDMEAVPIIVTDEQAGRLLGLGGLRTTASGKERYERLEYVREHASGMTFEHTIVESEEYDEKGEPISKVTRQVKYYVVGVIPEGGGIMKRTNWNVFDAFFSSLSLYPNYDSLVPSGYESEYVLENYDIVGGIGIEHVVEFENAGDAVRYMEAERCMPWCVNQRKSINEFMTNQTGVYFYNKDFGVGVMVAALFFGIIGLFVMMGVFSRIVGEERQATAIYRAVGASKADIRKIYFAYALMLSGIVAASAIVVGFLGSLVLHIIYAGELTWGARAMYAVTEGNVWLVGFDWRILLVAAVIMFIGVLDCLMLSGKIITKSIVNDLKE